MADVRVITNEHKPAGEFLGGMLRKAEKFHAASAFLDYRGLKAVYGHMERILANEGTVELIHGADLRIAHPDAIERLVNLKAEHPHFAHSVYCDWMQTTTHRFHPKLYLTSPKFRSYSVLVGSSNLTHAGLYENEEVNVFIHGLEHEELVAKCLQAFESMSRLPGLVEPDRDFVEQYRKFYQSAQNLPVNADPPDEFLEWIRSLQDPVSTIRDDPVPTDQIDVDWEPQDQWECAILALQKLTKESDDRNDYFHIRVIKPAFGELARELARRKKGCISDDVGGFANKGCVSDDVDGYANSRMADHRYADGKVISGHGYFEKGPRNMHRLSPIGRAYVGKRPSDHGSQASL